ncbi:MAG: TonB-dependent receptor plug domain-containing protein [Bacteroidales bacterium]|nr:TonB-dependent receptor plug domain-containing protein [Candidatus Cryptobacteroides caccocaballi]
MRKFIALAAAMAALCSCGSASKLADSESELDRNRVAGIGYQDVDTAKDAGSISRVKVKEEEISSYNSIFDYLRGRVAGVQIGNSGPGGTPSVTIRGEGSFNSNTQPLFVVDGAVVSDISGLNPYDIYSVDVIKDASTAIYGSRGANGVIVFKTKTAREAAAAEQAARKAAKAAKRSR